MISAEIAAARVTVNNTARSAVTVGDGPNNVNRKTSQSSRRFGTSTVSGSIKAARNLTKKYVFCVSNVSIDVTVSDIGDFLEGINAHMISCFEAKTKSTKLKAFRVCIDRLGRQAFLDTTNWPKSVILRPWSFKASSEQSDAAAPPDAGGQYMVTWIQPPRLQ